ncbi:hypothetical protein C1706_03490 [Propioniciclava flava]|uniref:Uncharacterized protein n=1 Tax=Propioniciclava flava TaxID=2072026 RepID=A0A4Q2EJS7_9ACTN|nr:hypothetical protein C1706_03490 [Propioniciclava flava]
MAEVLLVVIHLEWPHPNETRAWGGSSHGCAARFVTAAQPVWARIAEFGGDSFARRLVPV